MLYTIVAAHVVAFLSDLALANKVARCGSKVLFVHIHIPKSGGTSMSNMMRECAAQHRRTFAYGHLDNFLNMTASEQARVLAIDAHMGYGIHKHLRFPAHRASCVVYMTIARPYVDLVWSAMGHLAAMRSNATLLSTRLVDHYNPWQFRGALSYQLCCWADSQHPKGSRYSHGHLVHHSSAEDYEVSSECPRTVDEAAACAVRRLCNDVDIVGSTPHLDATMHRVSKAMNCSTRMHHDNTHTLGMTREHFHTLMESLRQNGSFADAAVMKFAMMLASGDASACRTPLASLRRLQGLP